MLTSNQLIVRTGPYTKVLPEAQNLLRFIGLEALYNVQFIN